MGEDRSQVTVRESGQLNTVSGRYALFLVNDSGIRVVPLPVTGVLLVGRGADADVRVADERMSRHHARIHVGLSFQIEDLHSANGTIVGGQPLVPEQMRALAPGEAVLAGNTTMLIRGHAPGATIVPAQLGRNLSAEGSPAASKAGKAMAAVLALADRAASSMISVLLLGETGVGKDVLAERIHRQSSRAKGPFLRLNCATFSPTLLGSELFGHEKGAFTGATTAQPGLLQSARGGTVLFDEIGDLPLDLQAQLLLVLERREVLPVGARESQKIDVRFIAATNHQVIEEVEDGTFRRDLYHRLNGVTIKIPPLRERQSEIEDLARQFAIEASRSIGRPPPTISREVRAALRCYSWPGNIRELRTVIDRAVLLGSESIIQSEDIIFDTSSAKPVALPTEPPERTGTIVNGNDDAEKATIATALAECGGNQSRAAKMLGISRNTLIARISKHGLARPILSRKQS
jgi:two-component system response regulator AtoC